MSLINKMLKDLAARDASVPAPSSKTILEGLRPAPVRQTRPAAVIVLGVLIAGALAAGIWLHRRPPGASAVPVPAHPVPPLVQEKLPQALAPVAVTKGPSRPGAVATVAPAVPQLPASAVAAHPVALAPRRPHPPKPRTRFRRQSLRGAAMRQAPPGPIERTRAARTPAEQAQALYHRAVRRLEGAHRHQAGNLLRQALGLDARALPPRLLLAGLAIQDRRYEKARALLTAGLVLHPHAIADAMLLAQVDLDVGQADAAVAALKPFARAPAARESFLELYASAAMRAGQMPLAARVYQAGVLRYPHSGVLWTGLGICRAARGRTDAARRAFMAALRCPLNPVLLRFVERKLATLPAKSGSRG